MYGSCEEAEAAASANDIRTAFQRFLGVMADAGLRRSEAAAQDEDRHRVLAGQHGPHNHPQGGLETVGGGLFVCVAISQRLELSPFQ